MVLSTGNGFLDLEGTQLKGCIMVVVAVLALAVSLIIVERVAMEYPADITLNAMMTISGTVQTLLVGAFTVKNRSSWKIKWEGGSHQTIVILSGGIFTGGLLYYTVNWCIHKKGPVFASSFSPLLIIFTFLKHWYWEKLLIWEATLGQCWSLEVYTSFFGQKSVSIKLR